MNDGPATEYMEVSMRRIKIQAVLACVIGSGFLIPTVHAQWAVIDAPAIVQLIQQVQNAEQQLATARAQLQQAQQALQTTTGARGMERLLDGTVRNYLPANWGQMNGAVQGSGGYGALSSDMQSNVASNSVLSPQRMATLSPQSQQLIQSSRQWTAMQQAIAHQALSNASDRFTALQSLISAIPAAADQKGVLDLQARISAELGMLQNEQTKLQVLAQSTQAQQAALALQTREQVINGHGRFDMRFQPTP
jgi:type IV secretion system protein VirB5